MVINKHETGKPCKNCGKKHPMGEVSGVKMNLETGCSTYEPEQTAKKPRKKPERYDPQWEYMKATID